MAAMHVTEETPQNEESSRQGLGCLGIIFGITIALIVIFLKFGYPHYHTLHSWLFWVIAIGGLLTEVLVIYIAIFVSQVVGMGEKKQ